MADIPASNWDETDANNTTAAPDGAPEGMAPSGVNNVQRAHQGAIKRFWNKINATATTGGTTSAYTLTYGVAPAAYVDGEIISFVVNATNAAAATINVNGLGAKALRLFGGNLLAGAIVTGDIVQARYGSSAGAFDIIPQNGWVRIGTASPSGASTVDFTSIPAAVNNLQCVFEFDLSADGADISLRTYGADGVLDSGASDYAHTEIATSSLATSSVGGSAASSVMHLCSTVDNSTSGASGMFTSVNIQASTYTKFTMQSAYMDANGTSFLSVAGSGFRVEADRITGIRILVTSGTFAGRVTLFGSV